VSAQAPAPAPKVSICIPAYRHPEHLQRLLEAVSRQSFTDYEVVVTDDSSDASLHGLIAANHSRMNVRYIRNPVRRGSPANWNEAVRHATGEYIKIMHHDDWFATEDSLGEFVALLDGNPRVDFAFSSAYRVTTALEDRPVHMPTPLQLRDVQRDPQVLFLGNVIGPPSATIYRRSVRHEFNEKLKWVVDIDFYIRVLSDNPLIAFSRTPLVCVLVDSPTTVTAECVDNPQVELPEWLYLLARNSLTRVPRYVHYRLLWSLLAKYDISSPAQLSAYCPQGPVPDYANALTSLRRSPLVPLKRGGRFVLAGFWLYQRMKRTLATPRTPSGDQS
jgi:glycosyltransferase involved in cell wall biosynthesis